MSLLMRRRLHVLIKHIFKSDIFVQDFIKNQGTLQTQIEIKFTFANVICLDVLHSNKLNKKYRLTLQVKNHRDLGYGYIFFKSFNWI